MIEEMWFPYNLIQNAAGSFFGMLWIFAAKENGSVNFRIDCQILIHVAPWIWNSRAIHKRFVSNMRTEGIWVTYLLPEILVGSETTNFKGYCIYVLFV